MADQPSVASTRVGKSKFAPVVAGDRKKAPTPAPPAATAPKVTEVEEVTAAPVPRISVPEPVQPGQKAVELAEPISRPVSSIEMVQQRRERRRSISNQLEPQATAETPSIAAKDRAVPEKRTLSYYLKDSREGVPMSAEASGVPSSNSTSGRATPSAAAQQSQMVMEKRSVATVVAPQVRVVDGEIVVDEENTAIQAAVQETVQMDIVHDSGRHLTSHAFVKTIGNNRWNAEDTARFYDALSMCGTDFSLMTMLFPNKSREQIKGKYHVEERNNPRKVDAFLKKRMPFDLKIMEQAQKAKEQASTPAPTPAETPRGRPKQDYEGTPLASIMASPRSSPKKSPLTSPTKSQASTPSKGTPTKQEGKKVKTPSPLKESPATRATERTESAEGSPRKSPRKVSKFYL